MGKKKLELTIFEFLYERFIKGHKDVLAKREIWEYLATLYNGNFIVKSTSYEERVWFQLEIPYKNHTIIMTESDTKPLKVNVNFRLEIDFKLNIFKESPIELIQKLFGLQDIEIGDKFFDKTYIIKSSDKELAQKILNNKKIRDSFVNLNPYIFDISNEKNGFSGFLFVKDTGANSMEELVEAVRFVIAIIDFLFDENLIKINN